MTRTGTGQRRRATVPAALIALGVLGLLGAQLAPGAAAVIWDDRPVLNIAHAGGDLEAPHSTLFAMKSAVAAGADVLEMDLRLSADGQIVVQHDATVDRTTNATGEARTFTAAELAALDNGYWFVPGCWSCHDRPDAEYRYRGVRTGTVPPPAGFTADDFAIPTLEQVVAAFPGRRLDVEIKDGPDGMATAEALASFVAAHGPADRWVVASFDDDILAHFKELAPDIATSPGLGGVTEWFGSRGPLPDHRVLQVPPVYSGIEVVTQQFVDDAHAAGIAVWVWFDGNDDDAPAEWERLIALGVDGLITGKPEQAEPYVAAAATTTTTATSTTTSSAPSSTTVAGAGTTGRSELPATGRGGPGGLAVVSALTTAAGAALVRVARRRRDPVRT